MTYNPKPWSKLEVRDRLPLDEAYMQMSEIWAMRSKAQRLQVGALLVKGDQIISDGYNGMPSGCLGEDEVCEEWEADPFEGPGGTGSKGPTLRTKPEVLHAEANAIAKLAKNGGPGAEGSTLYCTYSPCPECAKLILQAKIKRVVYRKHYRLPEGIQRLEKRGVECVQLKGEEMAEESFGKVSALAVEVFGDEAVAWLGDPHPMLDGKTPNEADEQKVLDILNAIKHGGVV